MYPYVPTNHQGRTNEVPSEDPYVLGQYATGYTKGLQNGPNPRVPMAVATLKHWLANNVEGGVGKYSRMNMDANVSAYDLASSYTVAFESAIRDAGALGIMW